MKKIEVKAVFNCASCLGSGMSLPLHAICNTPVCRCVTEQLRIIVVKDKDYSLTDRYKPRGNPDFVVVEETV